MTPDAIFGDPRLARLYDALNPVEDDQLGLVEMAGSELRTKDQVAAPLREAGFDRVEWWSDWRGTPFTNEAAEIVAVARVGGRAGG